jgi:hypothetical protein
MGIYQVTPGSDYWQTNFPTYFEKAQVTEENVTKVVISEFEKLIFSTRE